MSLGPTIGDIVTVGCIESVVKNDCWNLVIRDGQLKGHVWRVYKVWKEDGAEVWIVRPDGLRRAWSFKVDSIVEVSAQAVMFRAQDVKEELSVDEDAQQGKQRRPTVA